MILTGGQFGGSELESLTYTLEGNNYNVEGWLYTQEGIFNGMA